MSNDVALLIARAQTKGAALRVREGQLEVLGLSCLPDRLCTELRRQKADVISHIQNRADGALSDDTSRLLAWATELADSDLTLSESMTFEEARSRTMTTYHPSWCAGNYLTAVAYAEVQQHWPPHQGLPPEWWKQRGEEAIAALAGLKVALEDSGRG